MEKLLVFRGEDALPTTPEEKAEAYADKMIAQVIDSRRGGAFDAITKSASPFDALWRRGLEHLAVRGQVTDAFSEVGIIYTLVSTISRHAASVPWGIYRGEERIGDMGANAHPLYGLFRAPNDHMRGNRLFVATYAYRELRGRAFWILDGFARSNPGSSVAPKLLRVPDPRWMTADVKSGELVSWRYSGPEGSRTLSKEQVIRFAYFDPGDPYGGVGPLTAARLGYNLAWKSARAQELFYQNGAVPPFYVKIPESETMSADQIKTLRERIKEEYLGLANTGKPIITTKGAEILPISVNQHDAEWAATQRLTTTQLCSIFEVPPFIAGFADEAHLTNSTVFTRNYWGGKIRGCGDDLADVLNADLLARFFPGDAFAYDWKRKFAEVLPEEIRSAVESAAKMWATGVPAVAAYAEHGIELDTTDQPHLEIGYIPFSMTPADASLSSATATTDSGAAGTKEAPPRSRLRSEKQRAARWRMYAAKMEAIERRYLGDWRKFLGWLGDETVGRLKNRSMAPSGLRALDIILRDDDASSIVPPKETIHGEAKAKTDADAKLSVKVGWESLLADLGISEPFNLLSPRVVAILMGRRQSIVGASDTVASELRATLSEGLAAGETVEQLAARIRTLIGEQYRGQARTVARTETAAGFSQARTEAMRESGVTKHEWLSARDDLVRPSHVAADGEVVTIGEPFSNGLIAPLDEGGPPEEVINCRCVALPVVED